ncbi:hypothetical protein BCL69_102735 [Nitrosomonas communis]|uniref:Uncharacterized protein n=1 Tax=Nitrosomonas communis TaxID=44574 RepID=A0A5D3YEB9_9PROT|nr:hypothetical protein BCL69_102735 [Nitrosomonas communis]
MLLLTRLDIVHAPLYQPISHFVHEHFPTKLDWPRVLMICGLTFIAIGSIVITINHRISVLD